MSKRDIRGIGVALRQRRLDAGLSAKQVSQYVGISISSLYNYESGMMVPSRPRAEKLAELLKTTTGELWPGLMLPEYVKGSGCILPDTSLGNKLRIKRQELGLTQSQLARQLGVRQNTISTWERDIGKPQSERIRARIREVLGITVEEIWSGEIQTQWQAPVTIHHIGHSAKRRRIELGMSREKLAEICGCGVYQITAWENNPNSQMRPNEYQRLKLVLALKLPLSIARVGLPDELPDYPSGFWLRFWRLKAGVRLKDLASTVQVSRERIRQLERKERYFLIPTLAEKLAHALNISLSQLLGQDGMD